MTHQKRKSSKGARSFSCLGSPFCRFALSFMSLVLSATLRMDYNELLFAICLSLCTWVFPRKGGTPKSSILIGFSIIFTIHFGGPPLFLETPTWTSRHKETKTYGPNHPTGEAPRCCTVSFMTWKTSPEFPTSCENVTGFRIAKFLFTTWLVHRDPCNGLL